ncbi:carbohydrate-binding protein [Nocardia sp. NPDC020380]|uniref:carbohydrate-binding protein n=1 Tax=Nocardia sp. NPDC020380 TaxID=3364309 RepID=UPI003794CFA0
MMIGHVRWGLGVAGIAAALAMGAPAAGASAVAPVNVPAAEHSATAIDWGWPTAGVWQQGANYNVGDVVSYGGLEYQCIQAHTAYAPDWTPPQTPALWQQL